MLKSINKKNTHNKKEYCYLNRQFRHGLFQNFNIISLEIYVRYAHIFGI